MIEREKGFYCLYRYNVYYGFYPKAQVSGSIGLSKLKAELFRTDMPFSENDHAVILDNNHAMTQPELENLEQAFTKIVSCLGEGEFQQVEFEKTEQQLGVELPKEIRLLYTALYQINGCMSGSEYFLPLEQLYLDGENLIFYKLSKRKPIALSLSTGRIMDYDKSEWVYDKRGKNFLCFTLGRMVVKSILDMPIKREGRIGGELKRTLSPAKMLKEIFRGRLKILEEYQDCGTVILWNERGTLGWFRSNGFYADILIGCREEELLSEILLVELSVKWK